VQVAQARLAAAQAAQARLTVTAPARGSVTSLLSQTGSRVDPASPIATVADIDRLAAVVDLSEFDVAQVQSGMRAVVAVDALGGKAYPGKVGIIAASASSTGGVVSFPVQVTLKRSKGLRPGLNVSVRVIVAQRKGVVRLPLDAVSNDAKDEPIVRIVDASGAEKTQHVTLGLANNKLVEIVKGLKPGTRVLLGEPQGAPGG
jgi:RND family efflux transporter MFP subunit